MKRKDLSQRRSRTPKGHPWQEFGECSYCPMGQDYAVPVYEWQGQYYCIYCLTELKDRTREKILEIERPGEEQNFIVRQANNGNGFNKNISIGQNAAFVSTWQTANAGTSDSNQITIPLANATTDCTIYWGDGNSDDITAYDQAELTHTYTVPGEYRVEIQGTFGSFNFNNGGDKLKLIRIDRWGANSFTTFENMFYGCANMSISAPDTPESSTVVTMDSAFRDCTKLDDRTFPLFNLPAATTAATFLNGVDIASGSCTNFLIWFDSINKEIVSADLDMGNSNYFTAATAAVAALTARGWNVISGGIIEEDYNSDYGEDYAIGE